MYIYTYKNHELELQSPIYSKSRNRKRYDLRAIEDAADGGSMEKGSRSPVASYLFLLSKKPNKKYMRFI